MLSSKRNVKDLHWIQMHEHGFNLCEQRCFLYHQCSDLVRLAMLRVANLQRSGEFISLQWNNSETIRICILGGVSPSWITWCQNDTQRDSKCQTESVRRSTAAPPPPENIICRASKGVCLRFKCDDNPLMCLFPFSFLSFPERTHLLLSGPHVPLVPADLKAPVQCSPCKKKKK